MIYIGIDPGVSGGYVFINNGNVVCHSFKTYEKVVEHFRMLKTECVKDSVLPKCLIEKQWGRPRDKPKTIEKLCGSYYYYKAVMDTLGIRYEEIAPVTWQKKFGFDKELRLQKGRILVGNGILPKPLSKSKVQTKIEKEKKLLFINRAKALYPDLSFNITKWNAVGDALLLAHLTKHNL